MNCEHRGIRSSTLPMAEFVRLGLASIYQKNTAKRLGRRIRAVRSPKSIREKLGNPKEGKKRPEFSVEWRRNIGVAASRSQRGRPKSLAHRATMSALRKGKPRRKKDSNNQLNLL